MTAHRLDGRALAADMRAELTARVTALRSAGVVPVLAVVIVGQDESSDAYIRGMRGLGERIGVALLVDRLPPDSGDAVVRTTLERHGRDPSVHGIILGQPLPAHLSIRRIADAMPVAKDVDAANPVNQGLLAFATGACFVPATPAAVMLLLERSAKWPLRGRDVTVIGRSNVVGLPVSLLLMAQNATVTVTHKETVDIRAHTRRAEIVVVAAGSPHLVDAGWLASGATVIDVGTTVVGGKLLGDVDFESAATVAAEITPVPGGVGPVTNVALMRNVVTAAESSLQSLARHTLNHAVRRNARRPQPHASNRHGFEIAKRFQHVTRHSAARLRDAERRRSDAIKPHLRAVGAAGGASSH